MPRISSRVATLCLLVSMAALTGCAGASTVAAPPISAVQNVSQRETVIERSVTLPSEANPNPAAPPMAGHSVAPAAAAPVSRSATLPPPTAAPSAPEATPTYTPAPAAKLAAGTTAVESAPATPAPTTKNPAPSPAISIIPTPNPAPDPTPTPTPKPVGNNGIADGAQSRWMGPAECQGGDVAYTAPPVSLDDTWFIEPMGKLHGGHVTPTDHTYIRHTQMTAFEKHHEAVRAGQDPLPWVSPADVMSPADGYITDIQAFPFGLPPYGFTGVLEDYRLEIWHTCAVATIYIHLGGLSPEILEATGGIPGGTSWSPSGPGGRPIRVRAGQVIGKVGAQGIDYSVHDNRVELDGFVVPSHYEGEAWKIHTVDPYAYFTEPLRSQMLAKSPRTVEPRGGRIDYDIDGRLVGNWFLEGTVDYHGGSTPVFCGNRPCPYWTGHLAIAYDHIDPGQIRISVGADVGIGPELCRVCDSVYGVLGNSPDPAEISPESGMVKYGLVAREYIGEYRVATKNIESQVLGTFLAQMEDQRTIMMEVVAGSSPDQVDGFSQAAKIYHR